EDDEDRLPDVLLELARRHAAVEVHRDREPQPFAEEVAITRHRSGEPALDELLALAARDPRRLVDVLDRQRAVLAERTGGVPRAPGGDRAEDILPSDQLSLFHSAALCTTARSIGWGHDLFRRLRPAERAERASSRAGDLTGRRARDVDLDRRPVD